MNWLKLPLKIVRNMLAIAVLAIAIVILIVGVFIWGGPSEVKSTFKYLTYKFDL